MALAPFVRGTQGGVLAAFRIAAEKIEAGQFQTLVAYNVPAENLRSTAAGVSLTFRQTAVVRATQFHTLAAVKGRVADPRLRVFTFTLDQHDFVVLRLGDDETLVYDVYSQQWTEWKSEGANVFRAHLGMNWLGAQALATQFGSSVVTGDDTFGVLWFLDPEQPFDDAPNPDRIQQELPIEQIITGQILAKGRENIPCYAIFLEGDNYGFSGSEYEAIVKLETSDDQGRSWDDHGGFGADEAPYQWTSLGQISAPGRMFRVTDNGVFRRIDSMRMNDDGE